MTFGRKADMIIINEFSSLLFAVALFLGSYVAWECKLIDYGLILILMAILFTLGSTRPIIVAAEEYRAAYRFAGSMVAIAVIIALPRHLRNAWKQTLERARKSEGKS